MFGFRLPVMGSRNFLFYDLTTSGAHERGSTRREFNVSEIMSAGLLEECFYDLDSKMRVHHCL